MRTTFVILLLLTPALLATAPRAAAQVLYGSIVGAIEDRTGSVIPGAMVTLTGNSNGQSRQTASTEQGTYSFSDVLPGDYSVTIAFKGFRTSRISGVEVTINTVSRVDAQLEVGEQADTVTVSADAAVLQTDKADVHVSLGVTEITQLPLPAYRNYQSLVNLVPGATPATFQNAVSGSPGRSLATNINGTVNSANNTRLDGAMNMRASIPSQSLYVPPAESIETVNISTNSFDAEQGLAGGAAINVITRSGTNQFHGVVFEHHTDSSLKARNFFFLDKKLPKDTINTYGGTLGGPIRKNKLFFFASWEGLRERSNFSKITTVPTDAMRAGDFSALNAKLYDPLTGNADGTGRDLFPNNMIPANRLDPIALKMQSLIPEPNLPGTSSNYFASAPVSFNRDNLDFKINWNKSDKTSFWSKYSAMKALIKDQFSLGKAGGAGMINGGGAGTGDVLVQVAAIGGMHTFSPSFLVDGNMAVSRDPLTLIGPDSGINYGLYFLGIPGTNGPGIRYTGLPMFVVGGFETFGNSETYLPKYIRSTYFTYSLNFGWTKGRHEMRFGADVARYRVDEWHPELGGGPRGQFNFDGSVTALRGGTAPNQFNNWAAFLLGLPQNVNKSIEPEDTTPRQWLEGYYFRDRWQVTPRLTLTLGLRWEYYPTMTRADRGIERYDPGTNLVYIGGRGSAPDNAGVTASKKLFAPRVGIAYRLGQNTVIRAGYGISIDPYVPSTTAALLFPFPVAINESFSGATAYIPYGTLENGIPPVVYPDLSSGTVKLPLQTTTTTLNNGLFKRGYFESFNLSVQRQLPGNFVGTAGYVGTRSIRQGVDLNINAAPPGGGNSGRPLALTFGRTADTTVFEPMATAKYDSLQGQLDRQFQKGLLMKISYTFSKAIDWTDGEGGTLLFNDPANLARNRALAGFDRTHIFRMAWVADLPFGEGKRWMQNRGIARAIAGGWQVNGIFSAYSGTPFTVTSSGASLNAPGETQTADQVKPTVAKLGGIGIGAPYYDASAFAVVTQTRYGISGRNILRGPGLVNIDASLFRNFKLTERFVMQFRAEAFNLSNTPHFNNPSSNASVGGFMTITSALTTKHGDLSNCA